VHFVVTLLVVFRVVVTLAEYDQNPSSSQLDRASRSTANTNYVLQDVAHVCRAAAFDPNGDMGSFYRSQHEIGIRVQERNCATPK
jgi:hypothetical protein